MRPYSYELIYLSYLFKNLISKWSHTLRPWGLGFQHINLEVAIIQPMTMPIFSSPFYNSSSDSYYVHRQHSLSMSYMPDTILTVSLLMCQKDWSSDLTLQIANLQHETCYCLPESLTLAGWYLTLQRQACLVVLSVGSWAGQHKFLL